MRAPTISAREVVALPLRDIDEARISALAATGAFKVLFLASSLDAFRAMQRMLPRDWSMPVPGEALNAAAHRLRKVVIDLDSHVWPEGASRVAWDASRLGERSPLGSTTMLNLARLLVFAEEIARPGRYLLVTDDSVLGNVFLQEARRLGASAGWYAPTHGARLATRIAHAATTLGGWIDGVRRRASLVRRFVARKLVLASWRRRRRPFPLGALRSADVLLTVWGRADTFPHGEPLTIEHNFGRLPELLREAGLRVAYLVYPLTYTSPFTQIAHNALTARETVALVDDFVPWWAGLAAAVFGLRFPHQVGGLSIFGVDAGPVVRVEAARDRRRAFAAEAMLLRHVGKGLARRGIRPPVVLHLYENQPWEKLLARGLRAHLPAVRVIAVQHAPFASGYLSFVPSRRSIAERSIPDVVLATGEGYAQWLRDAGVPDERIDVLGAVRYEQAPQVAPPGRAVLCCTGIDLDEAIELATKAAVATAASGRALVVNFHPVTDKSFRTSVRDAVARALPGDAAHVTFSTASMRELLGEAGVVLYTTSAACFEAVQAGRTAIYVARDLELDYDKLPDAIALRCRSVEDLRNRLLTADKGSPQSSAALAQWLAPVVDAPALGALLMRHSNMKQEPQSMARGAV